MRHCCCCCCCCCVCCLKHKTPHFRSIWMWTKMEVWDTGFTLLHIDSEKLTGWKCAGLGRVRLVGGLGEKERKPYIRLSNTDIENYSCTYISTLNHINDHMFFLLYRYTDIHTNIYIYSSGLKLRISIWKTQKRPRLAGSPRRQHVNVLSNFKIWRRIKAMA